MKAQDAAYRGLAVVSLVALLFGTVTVTSGPMLSGAEGLVPPAHAVAPSDWDGNIDDTIPPGGAGRVAEATQRSSVMFIENVGQFDEEARFRAYGGDRDLWLTKEGLWITVPSSEAGNPRPPWAEGALQESEARPAVALRLSFVGANPQPRIQPFQPSNTRVSYFNGNDPSQWHRDVPVWGGVRYVDLYPGVDLEIAGLESQGTWRLVVRDPGFPVSDVRLRVEGAQDVRLEGDLLRLHTAVGDLTLPLLGVEGALLQAEPRTSRTEPGAFEVAAPFPFPSSRSRSVSRQARTDDLLYATFLGGSDTDWASGVAVDQAGAAYVAGYTRSSDLPTAPGAFDAIHNGDGDAFVAKLDASGSGLAYATFLGGSRTDNGKGIAVDQAGAAYVVGHTHSSDFPTSSGAFDTIHSGNEDAFVAKLDASGSDLAYATFLGGSDKDYGHGIAVDQAGAAYVVGSTRSSDFPIALYAFDDTYNGDYDAFVIKLNATGSDLAYATFIGANNWDSGYDIAVDGARVAYVTGRTESSGFPSTPGAFDITHNGDEDAFVVKLNASGSDLDLGFTSF